MFKPEQPKPGNETVVRVGDKFVAAASTEGVDALAGQMNRRVVAETGLKEQLLSGIEGGRVLDTTELAEVAKSHASAVMDFFKSDVVRKINQAQAVIEDCRYRINNVNGLVMVGGRIEAEQQREAYLLSQNNRLTQAYREQSAAATSAGVMEEGLRDVAADRRVKPEFLAFLNRLEAEAAIGVSESETGKFAGVSDKFVPTRQRLKNLTDLRAYAEHLSAHGQDAKK